MYVYSRVCTYIIAYESIRRTEKGEKEFSSRPRLRIRKFLSESARDRRKPVCVPQCSTYVRRLGDVRGKAGRANAGIFSRPLCKTICFRVKTLGQFPRRRSRFLRFETKNFRFRDVYLSSVRAKRRTKKKKKVRPSILAKNQFQIDSSRFKFSDRRMIFLPNDVLCPSKNVHSFKLRSEDKK